MEQTCQIEIIDATVTPPVMFAAQKPQPILKGVSVRIYEGEWITLLGRNGSGKSTLAKVVAGFRTAGVTGKMIKHIESAAKGKPIPIVMQQPEAAMIGATPWEDVVLMLEQNEMEASRIPLGAEEALRKVGMGDRMFQPIETLSGGQKQLVAIAGCLAVQSPLLVLDEVTAMLDPEAASYVLEQVRVLQQNGVTVIWITQKLEELRQGDRIVAMNDGAIAFDGQADEWFDRSSYGDQGSVCEQLGFEAPYSARVSWELERQGVKLRPFPFTAEMLAEAVKRYER
ncbi:ATP-binding cassette domain-containing protein [Paenibacillus prosopidis]|uniref:Energy-coupling factor transport system ATP-binding protein n=1 Tax=Paenibacillus prosopidis TaxID=630520 RepID=A0A368W7X5_9BACL|nr:ATP-binding cassette domain-containing protein [Paenibacillus prosopidis]RCW50207.1 energy-coupling factor transport system ATP-binding protein [Paenibacillus prosopidis]